MPPKKGAEQGGADVSGGNGGKNTCLGPVSKKTAPATGADELTKP